MPAQPKKTPFVSQSKESVLLVECRGRGGENHFQSYKKALQKMQLGEVGGGTDEV